MFSELDDELVNILEMISYPKFGDTWGVTGGQIFLSASFMLFIARELTDDKVTLEDLEVLKGMFELHIPCFNGCSFPKSPFCFLKINLG